MRKIFPPIAESIFNENQKALEASRYGRHRLTKLKKQLQNTVKIMITGFPSLETGVKALDEEADAYPVKPVKPQEPLLLLEEKLKNREELQETSN